MGRVLVLVGPTGVGKTELSIRLAERFACPIISADSRQLYRELPIGTAAPTAEEQARVRHFLVGTLGVEETYNAGRFVRDAHQILSTLDTASDPVAIVAGGAMLYIDALLYGLDELPAVDARVRAQVNEDYASRGLEWLQAEVQRLDAAYWAEVDRQNPQRLMRCLEVCLATGRPFSEYRTGSCAGMRPDEYLLVGLTRPREQLYDRINRRVDAMIEEGLEAEARGVYGRLATPTVGYAELFRYFDGKLSREEAIRLIKQNSRHYAKRQLTWWRRNSEIHWINANEDENEQIHTICALLHADGMHPEQ